MTLLLLAAIVSMILALSFYSLGVWGEKLSGTLQARHLVFFWIGLVFDTTGTTLMGEIAGGWTIGVHSVTGLLAIVLMCIHAVWASIVLFRKREAELKSFHTFSLLVWSLWLVPFAIGMVMAMVR